MMSSISDDIGVHGDALKSLIGSEEESLMSDLVVVSFKGEDTADQVLNKLREMQKEYLIDVEDACVVVRNKDGKVRLKQAINLVSTVAVGGAAWGGLFGSLIGLLFLNPLVGMATGIALGAGAGALSGALADYGIRFCSQHGLSERLGR
jgi:uncharacterized membrane protein